MMKISEIACFYNRQMSTTDPGSACNMRKPGLVMNAISGHMHQPFIFQTVKITPQALKQAHDADYVDSVLQCSLVNGYGTKLRKHNDVSLYHCGSMAAAIRFASRNHTVAFSPSAGFHHAGSGNGWGYCTFNGIMVGIMMLPEDKHVLILDGDAHIGDGCLDIIAKKKLGGRVGYVSQSGISPEMFIANSKRKLDEKKWDLIVYQAGADALENDNYQSGTVSIKKWSVRDKAIFTESKNRDTPLVWNLAGGYGAPHMLNTIIAHYRTYETAVEVYLEREQD